MHGSFQRKTAPTGADSGTRPGLHGQTLISTGLVDWDRLLGGGLPLGTLSLIIQDSHSEQHLDFIRYFVAEGVATGQRVAWLAPTEPPEGFLPAICPPAADKASSSSQAITTTEESTELRIAWQYRKYIQAAHAQQDPFTLPRLAPPISSRPTPQAKESSSKEASSSSSSSAGSGPAGTAPQAGSQSSAARKAVEQGVGREWCHTFDLSRSMPPEVAAKAGLVCQALGAGGLPSIANTALDFLQPARCTGVGAAGIGAAGVGTAGGLLLPLPGVQGPKSVSRLVVQQLCSPAWSPMLQATQQHSGEGSQGQGQEGNQGQQQWLDEEQQWRAATQLMYCLKQAAQDTKSAVLVTVEADLLPERWLACMQHLCDLVMELGSLTDDSDVYRLLPDPTTAAALLSLRKLPSLGMLAPRPCDPELYVIRHKRKRLAITAVEVDPDAEARAQAAVEKARANIHSSATGRSQNHPLPAASGNKPSGGKPSAKDLEY